jgi:hypothetical protein
VWAIFSLGRQITLFCLKSKAGNVLIYTNFIIMI